MKLIDLRLRNFRQFYGETVPISFAEGDGNVTVIVGTNGGGKTSILNAFTWVLFDEVTPAFELPNDLVNHRAIFEANVGDTVQAGVVLTFEHEDYQYRIERCVEALRNETDRGYSVMPAEPPQLMMCGPDGEWNNRDDVSDCIGKILPRDLHSFFFFDGERIERIVKARKEDRDNIAKATKMLIGVEILDRAINHLNGAAKMLEADWAKLGDSESKKLIEDKEELEKRKEELSGEQAELEQNLDGLRNNETLIQDRLRELSEVEHLQRQRDELQEREAALESAIVQANADIRDVVSKQAYTVFLSKPAEEFKDLIDELRQRGELPAGIKKQFVEDLLPEGPCICGRSLDASDGSRIAVEEWMKKAGLADVEETAIRMGGEIRNLEEQVPEFWKRLERAQEQVANSRQRLHDVENQLEGISEQLKNSPKEEVAGLEQNLVDVQEKIDSQTKRLGQVIFQIKELDQDIAAIDEQIQKHRAKEGKQKLAHSRVQAAKDASDRIRKYRANLAEEFREDLEGRVRKLFGTISFKPYTPVLTEDYHLRLTMEGATGVELRVGASTGENQILSLSFIGSVISLCRDFTAKRESLPGPDSSQFPIVMDSPFGSLVGSYREHIAQHIPRLANQVVILVSQKQWQGEVEKTIPAKMGRAYILRYYSTKDDVSSEKVTLNGQSHDLVKTSRDGYEHTEVVEVNHG